jgi:hypothetical protein
MAAPNTVPARATQLIAILPILELGPFLPRFLFRDADAKTE